MNNEGRFGFREALSFVTLIIITKAFFTSPSSIVKTVGTSAWLATLVSCGTSLIFFLMLYLLMKRFPGDNIINIFEKVLGKVAGKIVSLIFAAYILYYAAMNLREFLEMIKAYNLPYTPPSIILASFIGVSAVLAYIGLEGLVRIAYVASFFVAAGIILILVLASPHYDPDFLKPYLGEGIDKIFYYGFFRSSAYEEVFILAIMVNSIHELKIFKKLGIVSLLIAGGFFSVFSLCYIMAFQYTTGSEILSGLFQLSKLIEYGRFFQRIEAIFLFIWVLAAVIAVSIAFYTAISVYCKAFKIQSHRPLLLPFSFLLFTVAMIPKNLSETIEIHIQFIRQYSFILVYFIPVLVLLIAWVFRKRGEVLKNEKV